MKGLLVTEKVQQEFIDALKNDKMTDFLRTYHKTLEPLSMELKKVRIPRKNRKEKCDPFERICIFFCTYFLQLLGEIVAPNTLKFTENSIEHWLHMRLLNEVVKSRAWYFFYETHEEYFDEILIWARRQKICNIYIERNSRNYCLFRDARRLVNRVVPNSELVENCFCCGLFSCSSSKKKKYPRNAITTTPTDTAIPARPFAPNVPNSPSNNAIQIATLSTILSVPESGNFSRDPSSTCLRSSPIPVYTEEFVRMAELRRSNASRRNDEPSFRASMHRESPRVHRAPSDSSEASLEWANRRREVDESFQRKLNAQNAEYLEEVRKLREKREKLNREADEEIRKLKEKSAQRIKFFLRCVALRIRWEGQQEEWEQWLKSARDPVSRVKNKFMDFTCKSFDMIRREYDEITLKFEFLELQKHAQFAYDKLVDDFGDIVTLSSQYEDKLFLKVLQKKISQMADKLCLLIEALEGFKYDEDSFSGVKNCELDIRPWDIPTASNLRRICDTANPEDYRYVAPPRQIKRSPCNITEI